jgi:hypothetical protein
MIELRLERRTLQEGGTTGPDQNIYRVLCIAMLDEADHEAVYTAEHLTNQGVNADQTSRMFAIFAHKIQKAAYAKDMNITSDLVDEDGEALKPYGWKRSNWIKHIPANVYNHAVEIINQACDMHEQSGTAGDTYWYGQSCGLIRVASSQYATHIERLNKAYEIIGHRASREGDAFRKVGLPLGEIDSPESSSSPVKKSIFRKKISMSVAAAVLVLFTGVASYQVDFWDTLRTEGLISAKKEAGQLSNSDQALKIYREAWLAYKEGELERSKDLVQILLGNPDYSKHWGNCYYLLAEIDFYSGNVSRATKRYKKSLEYYLVVSNSNVPIIHLALAKTHIIKSEFNQASIFLESMIHRDSSLEPHYYELEAWRIALQERNFQSSYTLSLRALSLSEDNNLKERKIALLCQASFFASLSGDVSSAIEHNSQSKILAYRLGASKKLNLFHQLNDLIILRELGQSIDTAQALDLSQEISRAGDPFMELSFDLAINQTKE